MESSSCPFISRDLLARIPESKRQELERHYTKMAETQPQQDNDMLQLMSQADEEMKRCPVARPPEANGGAKGACPFISSRKKFIFLFYG